MNRAAKGAAVFLDRDGTLIREVHHLSAIEQLEILPGVTAALRRLRDFGFRLVMVTNQSVVGRGALSEAGLAEIHAELVRRLTLDEARLDGIYYCPHHPTEGLGDYRIHCDCRKPKPGMIRRAAAELDLDPKISYVVGDQSIDMELAAAVGAVGILVAQNQQSPMAPAAPDVAAVTGLREAAEWITEHCRHANEE
jgi:D-glycero-D-manno-heptose 1,7-bisphosphate phosphatase